MAVFSGTLGKMDYSNPEESIKKMANYIRQLQEELEYKLANLDKANFNETGLDEITEPISAQIGDVEGAVTQLRLDMNGLSIVVQNGSEASVIQLKSGNITLSSGTITLSGMVTFSDLAGSGTTVINGANIQTGSISADRISGGTLQGVIIKSINTGLGQVWINDGEVSLLDPYGVGHGSLNFNWSDGKVHLDSNEVLKIHSGGNMSIESDGTLYISAPEIHVGSPQGGNNVYINGALQT